MRRRHAKKDKSPLPVPPTFAGVTKAPSASSLRLKAAAGASYSNARNITPKALRRRNARDRKLFAMHCEELELISPQDDVGRVPTSSKAYMFFDGSEKNRPATFPRHVRGRHVEVRSVYETKIHGGGVMYMGNGKNDPDFIVCPQGVCLKMLDLETLPGVVDNFLLVARVHPSSTKRECMIVGDSPSE